MKPTSKWPSPNYRVFLIVFSICTLFGAAGLVSTELFMPANPGGVSGRLAMYRYLGTATVCWLSIAMWAWYHVRLAKMTACAQPISESGHSN